MSNPTIIEQNNPRYETSVFLVDADGAHLINYVEDLTPDELTNYQSQILQFRVLSAAGLLYLAHSIPGSEWSDAEINYFDHAAVYADMLSAPPEHISFDFLLVDLVENRVLFSERHSLDATDTEQIIAGLRAQADMGSPALNEVRRLGDPAELVRALNEPDMPRVERIVVDRENRSTMMMARFDVPRQAGEPRARWILRRTEAMPNTGELFVSLKKQVESVAAGRKTATWRYCLLPSALVQSISEAATRDSLASQLGAMGLGAEVGYYEEQWRGLFQQDYSSVYMTLLYNWRYSQGIYSFDEELLKSLHMTSLPSQLDPTVLFRLPEYCVYVETPGSRTWDGSPLQGFFAMAEQSEAGDSAEPRRRLHLLLDIGPSDRLEKTELLSLSLSEPTLGDAIKTLNEVGSNSSPRPELEAWCTPYLVQLLYLCSEEPEIDRRTGPNQKPTPPAARQTRKGMKLFPPSGATVWDCGWRTGSFIRGEKARVEAAGAAGAHGNRRSPRGHIRRAHFHTFYAGPRQATEREVRIKWLRMRRINIGPDDLIPAVVKRVADE